MGPTVWLVIILGIALLIVLGGVATLALVLRDAAAQRRARAKGYRPPDPAKE